MSPGQLPGLVEGQGIDLVVPMSIDWAKAPWMEALLNGPADLVFPTGEAMLIERDRDFAGTLQPTRGGVSGRACGAQPD